MQDDEQQSADNMSDAIKLGVLLHHMPDASLREHLASELTSVRHVHADDSCNTESSNGENDLVRSDIKGSEYTREGCCLSSVLAERTLFERLLVLNQERQWKKERRATTAKNKSTKPKDVYTKMKGLPQLR